MIKTLKAENFKAIPYLETSALMSSHPDGVKFSLTKPNVIVGPNGAGKTALMTSLSMLTLSHFTSGSALDDNYVLDRDSKDWWAERTEQKTWKRFWDYLPGLQVVTDDGPAYFYRPAHMPGNEVGITHAMMLGYMDEARAYGKLTEEKSSGQQSSALLAKIVACLDGSAVVPKHGAVHWRYGRVPKDLERGYAADYDKQANTLIGRFNAVKADAMPVILMDEPEQSLDALAELRLWQKIEAADVSRLQVIVATHSLYPLMHPGAFNIIEAVPGYMAQVVGLMNGQPAPATKIEQPETRARKKRSTEKA